MQHTIKLIFFLWSIMISGYAQTIPFQVYFEPLSINDLGGLQAYAWGQYDGKWLIVGGRLDGLHRRQPFASFDVDGHNNQLIVVDPISQKKWTKSLSSLPIKIQEQLSSTNMEFYQEDNHLYLIGGYGYSATIDDHATYPNMTAIKISETIDAVINNKNIETYFRQIKDTMFAVTGGYLNKIYDTFYLTGGQKFNGRYNPMGPDHGPGFEQVYTDAIRKFKIIDNGADLVVQHLPSIKDVDNLHRRDYNVVPQIMPNGQEGLTAFSGVFQKAVDLPFLNCVNIDSTGHTVNNNFSQYYNHYHCAHIPLYSAANNEMHTLFFGGIAQYYDHNGTLVQDNNVPFVKTIARVTRNAQGVMSEYKLPIEMPLLLGASSEFIPIESIPHSNNEVIQLDELIADTTMIGYIYGGIKSTAPNIFFINDGTQSIASTQIYKVHIVKNKSVGIHELNKQSTGTLKMQVYPNPNDGEFTVIYHLKQSTDAKISIYSVEGKLIKQSQLTNQHTGENQWVQKIKNLEDGGTYILTIETAYEKATQNIIVNQ